MIDKKARIFLIAVAAILMLMIAKAKAQDFRMGAFQDHVSIKMDSSVDEILKNTSFIQWYGEKKVLKNEYGFVYNFKSERNPYQFEFLSEKEYKRFAKNNGPITIEFLDSDDEVIYKVEVHSGEPNPIYNNRSLSYHFVYCEDSMPELRAKLD